MFNRRQVLIGGGALVVTAACDPVTLARRLLMGAGGSGSLTGVDMAIPDPRVYDSNGGVTFDPISAYGTDLYGRIIKSTPGVVHFWRFATAFGSYPGGGAYYPCFPNSAGGTTLGKYAGSPTLGSPLVVGGLGSVRLNNGSLFGYDYFAQIGTHEIGSVEVWIKPYSLPADGAICAQWKSNAGWLLHLDSAGTLTFNVGNQGPLSASAVLSNGSVFHVVVTLGGTQVPDYAAHIYVNGALVASSSGFNTSQIPYTTTDQFRIGNYAGGAGSAYDAEISEVALYSRMLQPDEITQHYQAGLGVLWP